ncbi:MAG: hypothetical protein ABSD20_13330 [Terriglobales bacterium]|jgi:plastocyanin
MKCSGSLAFSLLALVAFASAFGQGTTVKGRVGFTAETPAGPGAVKADSLKQAVVWLTPADGHQHRFEPPQQHFRLAQKDKQFTPHLLIVPVGSDIDFPNHDPFFHNVFSLFDGKRFDLGLYESGSSRAVRFDRPGVSFIFCNIHSQMSAVVIALDTPYYAISRGGGEITIPAVPPGRYVLQVWTELAGLDTLKTLAHQIEVGGPSVDFGVLRVTVSTDSQLAHRNLFGQDYAAPDPMSSVYSH